MPITLGETYLPHFLCLSLEDVIVYLSCFTSNRKAQGLIVALSGNLERPLVGQGYTFVEPGSANLISFSVGIH